MKTAKSAKCAKRGNLRSLPIIDDLGAVGVLGGSNPDYLHLSGSSDV
jgi:hypothetical protein